METSKDDELKIEPYNSELHKTYVDTQRDLKDACCRYLNDKLVYTTLLAQAYSNVHDCYCKQNEHNPDNDKLIVFFCGKTNSINEALTTTGALLFKVESRFQEILEIATANLIGTKIVNDVDVESIAGDACRHAWHKYCKKNNVEDMDIGVCIDFIVPSTSPKEETVVHRYRHVGLCEWEVSIIDSYKLCGLSYSNMVDHKYCSWLDDLLSNDDLDKVFDYRQSDIFRSIGGNL